MSSDTLNLAIMGAGTVFGAALAASGVYSPDIIISQMRFQNFHVAGFPDRKCHQRYDFNIIGGILLGCGMTLSGACPGTILVQITNGIRSGYIALVGGLFGGILYTKFAPYLRQATEVPASGLATRNGAVRKVNPEEHLTVYQHFSVKESRAVLMYEILCFTVIISATCFKPGNIDAFLHPTIDGLVIGAGQIASLLLTGNAVGVSAAYGQLANLIDYYLFNHKGEQKSPALSSVPFSLGILLGSAVISWTIPFSVPQGQFPISIARAAIGGLMTVLGARVAGGCTSGHGISGMSTFSTSSIITVAAVCASGTGNAAFIR